MPEPIAEAAVTVAHRHHKLVFTHPSSLAGIQVAIASGVDILAHAPDDTRGVDDAVLRRAVARHMAMIPTLKLFSSDDDIAKIRRVVERFHNLGGELMFGTDTGYLSDYDVGEEYRQLGKAGLMTADITILESDPAADVSAFSRVRYTIGGARVIYSSR
jgi:imidazolonepropionase-like amidohydrolase